MANTDAPFGLRPVAHRNGAPFNGAVRPYYIPASYGTALFIGDPVVKTGTSNTAEVTVPGGGTFKIGTMPEINKATAGDGNAITGVIVGFASVAEDAVYNAASTARVAYVADDPDLVFEVQADGTLPAASVGLNAVVIYTNAGATATGTSGVELDTTSTVPAADESYQLTILGIPNREDNSDVSAANVNVLVSINNHTEAPASLGI